MTVYQNYAVLAPVFEALYCGELSILAAVAIVVKYDALVAQSFLNAYGRLVIVTGHIAVIAVVGAVDADLEAAYRGDVHGLDLVAQSFDHAVDISALKAFFFAVIDVVDIARCVESELVVFFADYFFYFILRRDKVVQS